MPKQLQAAANASDYRGYMAEDLRKLDNMAEPKRSEALRHWQSKFYGDLKDDLSCYREVVRELRQHREDNPLTDSPVCCDDVHTSMSLKVAHLSNDFAHLILLDDMLGKQRDLFDL